MEKYGGGTGWDVFTNAIGRCITSINVPALWLVTVLVPTTFSLRVKRLSRKLRFSDSPSIFSTRPSKIATLRFGVCVVPHWRALFSLVYFRLMVKGEVNRYGYCSGLHILCKLTLNNVLSTTLLSIVFISSGDIPLPHLPLRWDSPGWLQEDGRAQQTHGAHPGQKVQTGCLGESGHLHATWWNLWVHLRAKGIALL